jgi:hypothetical protein
MSITKDGKDDFEFEVEDDLDIQVEDDTPEEDRGRAPMPKDIVEQLEADELDEYSDAVKTRLKQFKKVWHDERREKERALREQDEAIRLAQRVLEENKRLKGTLTEGEKSLVSSYTSAAELEAAEARRAYKEAYEAGDSDKVVEAQERLNNVNYKLTQLRNYKPTLHEQFEDVQIPQQVQQQPQLDSKTVAWQERNPWWGTDDEMTANALGLHQKLTKQKGANFVGSDEYWQTIDTTMRRRFPDYFGDSEPSGGTTKPANKTRSATVVAPASRSTSSKKVVLKQSQLAIAKKLGLTPEQYAREVAKIGS